MADGPDIAALDERLARALADRLAAGAPTRPDAAAIALRAALAAAADLPTELGVAVWRRIEAAAASRPIAVWGPAGAAAAGRFGSALGLAAEPRAALDHARRGGLAVLALAAQNPWWGRLLAMPELRVIGALPETGRGRPAALVVAAEPAGPTGDDRTFWVTDAAVGDRALVGQLSAAGLAAEPIDAAGGLKLFAIAGYVQPDDARLTAAPGGLSGVIGAAPVF